MINYSSYVLLENRVDYLWNQYKDWFLNRTETPNEYFAKESFNTWVNADPTQNKQYLQWILRQLKNKIIRFDDRKRVERALVIFDKNKSKLQQKDINQYKTLHDLEDAVEGFAPESEREKIDKIKKEGSDVYYEDDKWLVLHVHTPEALCYYGKNTRWCTSNIDTAKTYLYGDGGYATIENISDKYLDMIRGVSEKVESDEVNYDEQYEKLYYSQGVQLYNSFMDYVDHYDTIIYDFLWIFIDKQNKKKYQATQYFDQFMDETDRPVKDSAILDELRTKVVTKYEDEWMKTAKRLGPNAEALYFSMYYYLCNTGNRMVEEIHNHKFVDYILKVPILATNFAIDYTRHRLPSKIEKVICLDNYSAWCYYEEFICPEEWNVTDFRGNPVFHDSEYLKYYLEAIGKTEEEYFGE